jgi:hypothetical protein
VQRIAVTIPQNKVQGTAMSMFQLIYMSSLITDEPGLLHSILDVSVRNNGRNGITGMMLYADGNVIQVLEGEKDAVHTTFQAIEMDKRHTGIFVLIEQEIASREFASWSMGFRQLAKAELEKLPAVANVFKVQQEDISLRIRAGDALTILKSFADGSMSLV